MPSATPSDLHQINEVLRYELVKQIRGQRMLAILLITSVVASLVLVLPPVIGFGVPREPVTFLGFALSFVPIVVALGATFFGSDALVSEFQQKTGFLLFPQPVRRRTLLWGKFIAGYVSSALVVGYYYAIAGVSVYLLAQQIPEQFLISLYMGLVYAAGAMALAFLISSAMKGTAGALVLTFFLFFLILFVVETILTAAGHTPWFLLNYAGGVTLRILSSPFGPGSETQAQGPQSGAELAELAARTNVMGYPLYLSDVTQSLTVIVLYAMFALVAALVLFERREMT